MTVFTLGRCIHLAAEGVGEGLHPITDAEDGKSAFKDELLDVRCVLLVDRFGTAGQNKSLRWDRKDFFLRRIPWEEFAIDLRFAYAPGDDLGILGTEVQNCY